jgi:dolichyldiphosphatase
LWIRCAESFVVCIGAGLVSMSRVYLRYHTPRQVLIGVGIGAFLGLAWYITVMILRMTGWVDWILHVKVIEMLWFKDGDIGSLEHDLQQEWLEWRSQHLKHTISTKNTIIKGKNGITVKEKKRKE